MSNPFSGIITQYMKDTHQQMIEALLEDEALTVRCVCTHGGTKYTLCPNCIYDGVGGKSTNKYKAGGPVVFANGLCPVCNGAGKKTEITTSEIYLMPIWDSKKWILSNPNLKTADIACQTMSKMSTFDELKRLSKIVIDADNSGYSLREFTRFSDPEPLGFGRGSFILTNWKRS